MFAPHFFPLHRMREQAMATKANSSAKKAKKIDISQIKLSANYRPSEKEEYMCPNQLRFFHDKLVAWKEELLSESLETLQHLREENWNEPDVNDRASVETETALELKTRDRYRKLIEKIDAALKRIENEEYGYCEETGEEIGLKRLEARPIATLSIEAQERHENYERTHMDEEESEI